MNVSLEEAHANIRFNSQRKLFWLHRHEVKKEPVLIVGSGPSLADDLETIREMKVAGGVIIALNGAAHYLAMHRIEVDWQVMVDARSSNIRFLEPLCASRVLMASQCSPYLFDQIAPERIVLFHSLLPGLERQLPPKTKFVAYPGGVSSGLTALCAVCGMGYRDIHLFGYDSSDRGERARPFHQTENDQERERIEVVCAGRKFRCSPTMYQQAMHYHVWAQLVENEGAKITLHGDGLLPTMVRERSKAPDIDAAIYDLNSAPASWDFLVWLANARMAADRRSVKKLRVSFMVGQNLGFRNDDLPLGFDERTAMLDGVMRPALDLFDAVEDPTVQIGHGHDYMLSHVSEMARNEFAVPIVRPPRWAFAEVDAELKNKQPIVITLREASHWPSRNSNLDAWLDFADTLSKDDEEVIIVRDTERALEVIRGYRTYPRASLDIKVRAALYERAKANLFVANGPIALAYFGTRPFLIFKPLVDGYQPATAKWWSDKIGVEVGQQYPWCRPDQRIVWDDDSYENITRAWAGLLPLLTKRSLAA